jgi:hypothetical protein
MTTADASNTDGDKPAEGEAKPEAAAEAKPEATAAEKKSKLTGRTAALGVGIGIGSAALVAALLYANRSKPGQR